MVCRIDSHLRGSCGALALGASLLLTFAVRPAAAFTIQTPITRGCHEEITADALRAARAVLPDVTGPLPSRGEDEALMADAPFAVPGDLDDIGAVTLLFGARDVDMKNLAATDFDRLAAVNADPETQREHCLRAPDHDEPSGSRDALEDCRAYIRETLLSALEGLDPMGRPDGSLREELEVTLDLRGKIKVNVPLFYLRVGRALHALEDSFTHTFRSVDDARKVTVVLNWIEYAEERLHESTDGPPHSSELDRCDDPDDLRKERRRLAVEAASAALQAVLDPALDRAAKAEAVDAMLDEYLSFDTSRECTAENRWCDAPELRYGASGCGCRLDAPPTQRAPVAALALGAALLFASRRRRRRTGLAGTLLLGGALAPSIARGAPPESNEEPGGLESPIEAWEGRSRAGTPGKQDPAGSFFARGALGASYQKPALSGGVGVRYQLSRPLMFGFDAEWNPWIATSTARVRAGSINAYLSAIRRFQLKHESLNVRTTAALGASVLLIDLVGAPAGSVGPFIGLSFLGVEWKWAPGFYLTIDPTYIAFPIPHLTGAPFGYLQYRFLVGLEFGG